MRSKKNKRTQGNRWEILFFLRLINPREKRDLSRIPPVYCIRFSNGNFVDCVSRIHRVIARRHGIFSQIFRIYYFSLTFYYADIACVLLQNAVCLPADYSGWSAGPDEDTVMPRIRRYEWPAVGTVRARIVRSETRLDADVVDTFETVRGLVHMIPKVVHMTKVTSRCVKHASIDTFEVSRLI